MTDVDLYEWIDKLQEEELRGVIKYLVLLNAEAVQNAMNYTLQQQQREKEREEGGPPPPLNRTRSTNEDILDDALPPNLNVNSIRQNQHQRPTGHVSFTPNPQLLSATMADNISLVILCSMKPATKQDAIDQDEAMALCKHIGVLPYIVLAESKPEKLQQLLAISNAIHIFPQFFLSDSTTGNVEFLGTYEIIQSWHQQGILTGSQDLVKLSTAPRPKKLHFEARVSEPALSLDLYQHLLHINNASVERTVPQPIMCERTFHEEAENARQPRQSLEPPEEKDVLSQSHSHNRREEPPAKSPPKSSKKKVHMQEIEQPSHPLEESTPPPTPNPHSQVVHYDEPPAVSPPKTTTKSQRRRQESDGIVTSTPNAHVVKKYSMQKEEEKPEPSPGGGGARFDSMPLEPPTVHKESSTDDVVATPLSETKIIETLMSPETPVWMEKLESQTESPAPTNKVVELPEEKAVTKDRKDEAPASDQLLSILNGIGACYLVYDQQNTGQLNIYYSESPMEQAVGVWTAPDILDFKEAQGLSESEFIGNCASDCVSNSTNYCKGWGQFVKAAKSMGGTVITLVNYGIPVDFYLYSNNQGNPTCEKLPGIQFDTADLDAVACLPKDSPFDYMSLRGRKWSKEAKKVGSVAMFNSLVHNTGAAGSSSSPSKTTSSLPQQSSPGDLQANPTDEEHIHVPATAPLDIPVESVPAKEESEAVPNPEPDPVEVEGPTIPEPVSKDGFRSSLQTPSPEGGACYLVYEPGSSGRMVEYYSRTPVEGAIGRWVPGEGKKIAGFKFKQNLGRSVLIGNCSAGVQGRKNYCSGWNQFVRSAKVYGGTVMLWDPPEGVKGMAVDVWLYKNDTRPGHQSQKLSIGVSTNVDSILAVCTIPKNTRFYDGISVDLLKWLADGSNYGVSSKFE